MSSVSALLKVEVGIRYFSFVITPGTSLFKNTSRLNSSGLKPLSKGSALEM